ncbi:hypothetical protein KOR34_35780 [Posidoniimonas corsicana]|uniref:Uncharacterized protein n=2 Tax=Posidoniimonas corsicana TaxID=1938618 RepID=A0A5C5V7L1_9BACT|nr:hypothetical protein KOR34_35780 [Posidoniimonas corsicana]
MGSADRRPLALHPEEYLMNARKLFLSAAAAALTVSFVAEQADAAWRWRRRRAAPRTTYSMSNFKYSSGIARGEYERFRRLDNWYNDAYNGFRPSDFR